MIEAIKTYIQTQLVARVSLLKRGGHAFWGDFFEELTFLSLCGLFVFTPISIAGTEIMFGFSLIFYVLSRLFLKKMIDWRNGPTLFLIAFFLFSLVSVLMSGEFMAHSAKALLRKWSEYFIIFVMVFDVFKKNNRCRVGIWIIVATAVLMGFDGILQWLIGVDPIRWKDVGTVRQSIPGLEPQTFRAISATMYHYNNFGGYVSCMAVLILALIFDPEWFKNTKKIMAAVVILLLTVQFLTFSRGSYVGLAAGLTLLLVLSGNPRILATMVVIAVIVLVWPPIRERLLYTFDSPNGFSQRLETWKVAWAVIQDGMWWGKGVGTFMNYSTPYSNGIMTRYAHNCYLQVWAEMGLFALICFIGFFAAIGWRAFQTIRVRKQGALIGLVAAIGAFLAHAFFDNHFYSVQLSAFIWSIAGLAYAYTRQLTPR